MNFVGSVAGPDKLQHVLDKNQEMFNSFIKAVEELSVLRNNLNKTEVFYHGFISKFILTSHVGVIVLFYSAFISHLALDFILYIYIYVYREWLEYMYIGRG